MFGKLTEPSTSKSFIPNAPRTRRMLPERVPYMPYAPRMFPEYFPNTHGRHIRMVYDNYFEHAQHIFGATECRSVCIRAEPNSQYAPRTHRLLPEYDPFQTEWHSGLCNRAMNSLQSVSLTLCLKNNLIHCIHLRYIEMATFFLSRTEHMVLQNRLICICFATISTNTSARCFRRVKYVTLYRIWSRN